MFYFSADYSKTMLEISKADQVCLKKVFVAAVIGGTMGVIQRRQIFKISPMQGAAYTTLFCLIPMFLIND